MRLHRIHHALAGVAGHFTEVGVLAQVLHGRGIGNATEVTVGESWNVPLPHVGHNLQQVILDAELGRLASVVGGNGGAGFGLALGEVIAALGLVSLAVGFCLEQLVCKNAIPPSPVTCTPLREPPGSLSQRLLFVIEQG
jgi:hypothetical protein